ncbi:hypothetical protein D3C73_399000 [compost metagenome]
MSDQYAVVLKATKKIEALLTAIGSEGRGLTEKCLSVEHLLPPDIVWSIKRVAADRNKLIHEEGFELKNIGEFSLHAGSVIDYLEKATKPESAEPKRKGLTISVPEHLVGSIPITEMDWLQSKEILFPLKEDPDD